MPATTSGTQSGRRGSEGEPWNIQRFQESFGSVPVLLGAGQGLSVWSSSLVAGGAAAVRWSWR